MAALCLLPKAEFMAREMYGAMSGIGTSKGRLNEIHGNGKYGHPVKDDIKDSGDFESLLLSLVQCQKGRDAKIDVTRAKADDRCLFEAGAAKLGTDEKVFYSILTTRSWPQLHQTITSTF
ncbi:putative Annexin [Daphnia magna]|uniref:Putative Annexin n=1 Tax=Daphnia magna TaxID=35525 RepID=A0A164M3M0_9CRUS|nr:putative Annexin [Daphnia magna]